MARSNVTVYLDPDVLRATQVRAARTGRTDSEIIEEALREYLGLALIDRIGSRFDLTPEEAERLANEAVHEARREQRESGKS
jgi:predicted transcriptional regulator